MMLLYIRRRVGHRGVTRGGDRQRSGQAPCGRPVGDAARGLSRYYTHNLDTEEPAAENTPTPASCCLPSDASHPGEEIISRRVKKRGRKRGEGARVRDAGKGGVAGMGRGRSDASGRRVTLGHVRVMAPEADTRADMIPATGLTGDAAALLGCPAIERPPTRLLRRTCS